MYPIECVCIGPAPPSAGTPPPPPVTKSQPGAQERDAAVAAFASAANASLDGVAGSAATFTSAELPALREALAAAVRARQDDAAGALGALTAETDGLHLAVMRAATGMAGALNGPLQRTEARCGAAARAADETAELVRRAVDAGTTGLLKGVAELAERIRESEKVGLDPRGGAM
jgi:hypothetical protein